jgi:glycosyltransferase involved in cell wall biosynthesis
MSAILQEHPDLLEHMKPSLLLRAHHLQTVIHQVAPDLIFSFLTQTNLACLVAGYRGRTPILISERNDVLLQPVAPHVSALRTALYPRAEIISANSPPSRDALAQWFPGQDVLLMPNDFPQNIAQRALGTKKFGVVCRLEKQKNVDLIIRGFVKSGLSDNGWSLEVWGEGPELENLVEIINDSGVTRSVRLHGVTSRPLEVMAQIDFLLAASSYEGSSNSIHEAVSAGAIPVFSETITEMSHILPPGLREIFSFRPDPADICQTLQRLSTDDFRGSELVGFVRENFARYWLISRKSRIHFLDAVTEMLGWETRT